MISVHQPQVKPQRSKQFESLNARRLRVQIGTAFTMALLVYAILGKGRRKRLTLLGSAGQRAAFRVPPEGVSGLSASTIAPRTT